MSLRWLAAGAVIAALGVMAAGCARGVPRAPAPKPRAESASLPAGLRDAVQALKQAGAAADAGKPLSLRTYLPSNMYEAIDGEADLFLSYGAKGLAVARYKVGTTTVDAEVFDQARPLDAFGVFSQLRGTQGPPVAVGAQGVSVAGQALHFWKSRYFVRLSGTGPQPPPAAALMHLAQGIEKGLKGSSGLPAWTRALPLHTAGGQALHTAGGQALHTAGGQAPAREGEAPQYVARNVLGHGFLSNAMIADYGSGESECRLALVRAKDETEAASEWSRLRELYSGAPDRALEGLAADGFVGANPQQRPVYAVHGGRHVVIVVGRCGAAEARRLLASTLERLRQTRAG